jgi:hypothetical protein
MKMNTVCKLITTNVMLHPTEKQIDGHTSPSKNTCVIAIGRKMCSGCKKIKEKKDG